MKEHTTNARWSQRLHQIQSMFDDLIKRNKNITTLPALHNYDYKFYFDSVVKLLPFHKGAIYYRGREVRKIGGGK
jgi:hypothetical protein